MNGKLFRKCGVIFLSVTMLLVSLVPVQGLAQYEKGLEEAIIRAKTLFDIQDSYDTFNYSIQNQNSIESYNMNWTDSKNKKGNISVNMLSTGEVMSYYSYKPYTGEKQPQIPSISKADSQKIAEEFIGKINPSWVEQLKSVDNNEQYGINNDQYHLRYTRIYNGIPFPENYVQVSVNNQTGDVQSFHSNWSIGVKFPEASGVISPDKARQAYKDKIGLKLLYRSTYKNDEMKLYPAYGNVYGNRSIDAFTGELYERNPYMYGYASNEAMMDKAAASKGTAPVLTPSEKQAIEKIGQIITAEKAEEIARNIAGIDEAFTLESKNLINDWQNRDEFQWGLNFIKKTGEKEKLNYYNTSVTLDAKTGELLGFYKGLPYDKEAEVTLDKEKAVQAAEEFLKSVQQTKFEMVERTEWNESVVRPLTQEDKPRSYNFIYTRKENGAYFPGNGFNITVDTVNGSIMSFNCNWYKKELPSVEGIKQLDEAYGSLFDNIGLQLQYVITYPSLTTASGKFLPRPLQEKPELKLVYAINQEKPLNIDPFTGKVLNFDGTEYKDKSEAGQYTDIAGHEAESQIKVLAEYGIALPGQEFKPAQDITQKEFLFLLMKTLNPYNKVELDNEKAEEIIYNYSAAAGIIKDDEKAPDASITVQEAARFIVRAQHYDKVAEMKGIFALSFNDVENIEKGMEGYIAIAYGMKVIKDVDGYIYPVNNVTRAGAVKIIYSFLTVQP